MTNADTRANETPDGSPREHWTTISDGTDTIWRRHTWSLPDARGDRMLEAFLGIDVDQLTTFTGWHLTLLGEDDRPAAVLIHPDRLRKLEQAAHELEQLRQQPEDAVLHPALHGPGSGGEGLLIDTEPIREAIKLRRDWIAANPEKAADLALDPELADMAAAVSIACRVVLTPDDDGVLPVRSWAGASEGASRNRVARWMLAWPTPARGLFVRGDGPVFWGEDYAVISGSGYKLRAGFISREVASDYAAAIAAAVPGIDWRVWTAREEETPPALVEAIQAENARWTTFGLREDAAPAPAGGDR